MRLKCPGSGRQVGSGYTRELCPDCGMSFDTSKYGRLRVHSQYPKEAELLERRRKRQIVKLFDKSQKHAEKRAPHP